MTLPPERHYRSEEPYIPTEDEKNMALVAHFGVALAAFIPALVIYFIKKESFWVRKECAKVLNFLVAAVAIQIVNLALFIMSPFLFNGIAEIAFGYFCCIVAPLWLGIPLATIVYSIINGIKVSDNKVSNYRLSIPIFKPNP